MKLIRLTAVPHPDINASQPYPVYVDADHIVSVPNARFTMLPIVYVTETPAQVADMMIGDGWRFSNA